MIPLTHAIDKWESRLALRRFLPEIALVRLVTFWTEAGATAAPRINLTSQAFEYDPDLLYRGELPARLAADVADGLLGRIRHRCLTSDRVQNQPITVAKLSFPERLH
jgi:hypothetical protein